MSNFYPPGFDAERNNIAIDFDGVLHDAQTGWGDGTCYGEPLPGAIDAIKELSLTFDIIIFSAKSKPSRPLVDGKTGTELVEEWFLKYDILKYIKEITAEKPRAELYIDDNGYRFERWSETLKFVNDLKSTK